MNENFSRMMFPMGVVDDVSSAMAYFGLDDTETKKLGRHVEGVRKNTILKLVTDHNELAGMQLTRVGPSEETVLTRFFKLQCLSNGAKKTKEDKAKLLEAWLASTKLMKNVYVESHWDQPELLKYAASLKLAWSVAEICSECKQVHPPHEPCMSTDFSKVWDTRIMDSENKCRICSVSLPTVSAEKQKHCATHTVLQNILGGAYALDLSKWTEELKYSYTDW